MSEEKKMLQIRVTKKMKDLYDELAKKEGRSTSNYIALLLENHARELGLLNKDEEI